MPKTVGSAVWKLNSVWPQGIIAVEVRRRIMNTQLALMILATLVVVVLVVSELLPMLVGGNRAINDYNFTRAKRNEKHRGMY
jgi:hypothetical protein